MKKFYLALVAVMLTAMAASAVTGKTYYVRGAYNGWGTGTAMTETSEGVYTVSLDQLTSNFKIATGDWSEEWASVNNTPIEPNVTYTDIAQPGNNMFLTVDKLLNVTVTLDTNVPSLLVQGETAQITEYTISICGQWNGWNTDGDTKTINVTTDGEEVVIPVSSYDGIYGFKIVVNGSWLGNKRLLVNNREYPITAEIGNMDLPAECNGKPVTFTYNVNTKNLKYTVDYPVTYPVRLVGSFNSWSGDANLVVADAEGNCRWDIANYNNTEGQGEGVKVAMANFWMGNGETLTLGTPTTVSYEGDNMMLPEECLGKDLTFIYNVVTDMFVVDLTSGASTIAADQAEAIYFNLQGQRVANPVAGQIYIVKRGEKVSKQIIR